MYISAEAMSGIGSHFEKSVALVLLVSVIIGKVQAAWNLSTVMRHLMQRDRVLSRPLCEIATLGNVQDVRERRSHEIFAFANSILVHHYCKCNPKSAQFRD